MTSLILVPLDDSVVFPTMDVTLPVDVGDEDRVLLIPRHDNAFATVGTIAAVPTASASPVGHAPSSFPALPAASPAPHTPTSRLASASR